MGRRTGERAGAVRQAATYVEAHAERAMLVEDIATACGLHVRTLYRSFTREYKLTPKRYLRQCRLERVRADLLTASRGTTVTTVAIRHGITHLGRFAKEYALAFGEPPSSTLRRAASGVTATPQDALGAGSGQEDACVA